MQDLCPTSTTGFEIFLREIDLGSFLREIGHVSQVEVESQYEGQGHKNVKSTNGERILQNALG